MYEKCILYCKYEKGISGKLLVKLIDWSLVCCYIIVKKEEHNDCAMQF